MLFIIGFTVGIFAGVLLMALMNISKGGGGDGLI